MRYSVDENVNTRFLVGSVLPRQIAGGESTVVRSKVAANSAAATALYLSLKSALQDVGCWNEWLPATSASFALTDSNGDEIKRRLKKNDWLRIRVPAGLAGRRNSWMTIGGFADTGGGDTELYGFSASPCADPTRKERTTAHFLKRCASTSFIVVRDNLLVSLFIISRNEVQNRDAGHWLNRLRIKSVGYFAEMFFSRWQWKKLAGTLFAVALKRSTTAKAVFHAN